MHGSMVDNTMNVEDAKAFFKREAVLFGHRDGVPMERAIELFGKDAIAFAIERSPKLGVVNNQYGIGEIQMPYLTEYGFLIAVTYRNIQIIHAEYAKKNN